MILVFIEHVLVSLSLPSPCSFAGVQFFIEHCLGDAVIGHSHKVPGPAELCTLDVVFDAILCTAL